MTFIIYLQKSLPNLRRTKTIFYEKAVILYRNPSSSRRFSLFLYFLDTY